MHCKKEKCRLLGFADVWEKPAWYNEPLAFCITSDVRNDNMCVMPAGMIAK